MNRQAKHIDKNIVDVTKPSNASSKAVRKLRRKMLADNNVQFEFESELLKGFAQTQANAGLIIIPIIFLASLIVFSDIGLQLTAIWFVIASLSQLALYQVSKLYLKDEAAEKRQNTWRIWLLIPQVMISASWVMFALLDCDTCNLEHLYILQFSILLVFATATTMMSHAFGLLALIMVAPAILTLAIRLGLTQDTSMVTMAGILLGIIFFFAFISTRLRSLLVNLLSFSTDKELLINELETEKSFSEEARRRAEDANMAKSRFLATMSHELRTPLNAILGFSEIIKDQVFGPIGNEQYREYASDIHVSGAHLLKVINEILDISRIEAGKHDLKEEKLPLVEVAEEARCMVEIKAKQKSVSLITNYDTSMPTIWIDRQATRQIILNLLSNALKFTPSGGEIVLTLGWTSKGGQYVSIKDSGPGIPEDEIPIVLSSFGQGSIALKDAEQGTGLGLTIVQALLQMHQGRFDLKSELRKGTEAIAYFPKERVTIRESLQPTSPANQKTPVDA